MRREVNYDEVFDAQKQFRIVLDSMSRPGKINVMPDMDIVPPAGINKSSALIAFALLNTDVTFYAGGENSADITPYIALNTTAEPVGISNADFIFINGRHNEAIVFDAKTGTLPYPEESATFIIDVETISEDARENAIAVTLKGPGVEVEKTIYLTGLNAAILNAVKEQNTEFPLGIDLILTDEDNRLLCIPRSNRFVVEAAETALAEVNN